MHLRRIFAAIACLQFLVLGQAFGADEPDTQFGRNAHYWEARFGAGAYDFGPATPQVFDGVVLNGEILTPSPEFLDVLGSPRPYLGGDFALSDDPIHVIYLGLNWELYLTRKFYLGFSGGGAWASSETKTSSSGATKNLGSSTLFHLQVSAGYDLTSAITMQIFYNHFSNANLRNANTGLESIGGRVGFRY